MFLEHHPWVVPALIQSRFPTVLTPQDLPLSRRAPIPGHARLPVPCAGTPRAPPRLSRSAPPVPTRCRDSHADPLSRRVSHSRIVPRTGTRPPRSRDHDYSPRVPVIVIVRCGSVHLIGQPTPSEPMGVFEAT
jgi:hypothetical protein